MRIAAMPLSASPTRNSRPRREGGRTTSGSIAKLLSAARVGLAGKLRAMRQEPRHDVGDLLRREWAPGNIAAPIGMAELRPAGDEERAQPLGADQREIGTVDDGARLRPAGAVGAVAA